MITKNDYTDYKSRLQRLICVILFKICVILLFSLSCYAQTPEEWLTQKGYFCTLYIKPDVNITALNRRIDTYRVDFGLTEKPRRISDEPIDEVLYKFDLVFLKVEEILDMRPRKIHPNVKIYRTKDDIDKVYVEVFNEEGKFIAFYVFKLNTLYACEEKISASVIAHEIAHCVIDHYFNVAPPKKIGEMLAHYVELNLRE